MISSQTYPSQNLIFMMIPPVDEETSLKVVTSGNSSELALWAIASRWDPSVHYSGVPRLDGAISTVEKDLAHMDIKLQMGVCVLVSGADSVRKLEKSKDYKGVATFEAQPFLA